MLARFEENAKRFDELERMLSLPDAALSPRYPEYLKEHGRLAKTVAPYREYLAARRQLAENEELAGGGDADLAELARSEIPSLRERLAKLEESLKRLAENSDEHADRDVIMEIRAGTGGEEAALFAGDLFRMYRKYLEGRGFQVRPLDVSESGMGGLKEVVFEVNGDGAYARLRYEGGTHRVQRVPKTEAQGRIHTSAITVAVMPEAEELDVKIDPKDLRIDTLCSSGPGGQSVNTTYSAVRIVHLPTNTIVTCQDERSQIKNREKAMRVMRSRLYEMARSEREKEMSATRRALMGSGDRSQRVRTYNFPQNRVTDHRVDFTVHDIQSVMDGRIDEIVAQLAQRDKELRLEAL